MQISFRENLVFQQADEAAILKLDFYKALLGNSWQMRFQQAQPEVEEGSAVEADDLRLIAVQKVRLQYSVDGSLGRHIACHCRF